MRSVRLTAGILGLIAMFSFTATTPSRMLHAPRSWMRTIPASHSPRWASSCSVHEVAVSARPERTPTASPTVEITYCTLCGWGLRAGWMAQELLNTFAEELGSVTLTPDVTGGVFEVRIDGEIVWSRKEAGRFPEIKELKQRVRDRIAPGRSLGHIDKP